MLARVSTARYGRGHVHVGLGGAYACGHLGTQLAVQLVVSHREDVVLVRVEPHAVVPIGSLVGGPHIQHALHEVGVAGDEVFGADTGDRP